ncbi:MAG: hypothetical protein AB1540_15530 [Bdellovibrionota bacterium]
MRVILIAFILTSIFTIRSYGVDPRGTPTPHDATCALYLTVPYLQTLRWSSAEDIIRNTPPILREGRGNRSQEDIDALLAYLRDPFVTSSPSTAEYFLAVRNIDKIHDTKLALSLSLTENIVRSLTLLEPALAFEEGLRIIAALRPSQRFDRSIKIFRAIEDLAEHSSKAGAYVLFFKAVDASPARHEYLSRGMFGKRQVEVLRKIANLPAAERPEQELIARQINYSLIQWRYLTSKKEKYNELKQLSEELFEITSP